MVEVVIYLLAVSFGLPLDPPKSLSVLACAYRSLVRGLLHLRASTEYLSHVDSSVHSLFLHLLSFFFMSIYLTDST